jgi:hypothetical protein
VKGSEFKCGAENRSPQTDIVTEIEAAARRVVEVHAAVAEMQVDRRLHGVVDGPRHLPVAVGANAKAAGIAISGQPEPVVEIVMVAPSNQRIDPADRTIDARSRQNPGFKLTFAEKPQAWKPTPKSAYWPGMSRAR